MSTQTAIQATDHALLGQAYEDHCERCPTCRTGDVWCDTGAAILTAIGTTKSGNDLPGYGERN